MVEAANPTTTSGACLRCGQVYRLPQWGRAYACAACGEHLNAPAPQPIALHLPKWLMGSIGVAVFAGCVMALSAARTRDPGAARGSGRPAPPSSTATNPTAAQPPEVTNRFREKIRYLEADLLLEPKNEALMHRLAYSHASLALSLRDAQPKEADEAMQRARQLARQRAQAYPSAVPPLDWVYQDLNQLAWAPEANGFMLPQMMQTATGQVNAMPGPMMNPPGSVRPPGPGMGPAGPTGAPPSSPGTAPPSFIASPMNVPQPTTRADQEKALRAAVAGGVARRAEAPDDLTNLYALGTAYQQLAKMEQDPRKRRTNVNLKLALEVYRDAARRSRTRIHKASHLSAAAEVYGEMGDSPNQYRMAKLASEQAPFSASVWDELQDAALRVGRFSDSRTAARKAREWQLPVIQGASLMPAQFGMTGTMASP